MGHAGLLPQSYHAQGGYRVQGRDLMSAERLAHDALCLEQAGAFAIVLECIPPDLARRITAERSVPTIGIGSGPHCDAQVLVLSDVLGMSADAPARFVRQYDHFYDAARTALERYAADVREGRFPKIGAEEENGGGGR
jgi:3-methyl-2-oxobutanoate hydroxymethyltransferase